MTSEGLAEAKAAETRPRSDYRWLVLVVVSIAQLMVVLDATVVNIALPSAQADLGFDNSARQWVVTAYALAFGSLLLLGGRVGDIFGRKRTFLVALVAFARRPRSAAPRRRSGCWSPPGRCREPPARCLPRRRWARS